MARNNVMGLIRGRIVHNNQFEIGAGLIQYALNGLGEVTGSSVERRDDDTDLRCRWGHGARLQDLRLRVCRPNGFWCQGDR